jgi:hypothetical protein
MMLHHRRKRLEELAKRESAGDSFWTKKFDKTVRLKILHALRDSTDTYPEEVARIARELILRDVGLAYLQNPQGNAWADTVSYLLNCDDDMVPTIVEAIYEAIQIFEHDEWSAKHIEFATTMSNTFREHRLSFDFIDGQVVEFSSRELHVSVVAPTLHLLSQSKTYPGVEKAYQDALGEIASGKPSDAITDAGTALQEMLQQLGCKGNALGPLIKSAKTQGFLVGHDIRMVDALDAVMNWVSADRSTSGDAHSATEAEIEDAWFTVHIVGALLLRLAGGKPRHS